MPEYRFEKVMEEGLRLKAKKNRPSTQKTDAWNAEALLRFFKGYWVTYDPMSKRRKVVTPAIVARYVEFREQEGAGPATIRRECAIGSRCIRLCIQKLYWEMPNPFANPDIEPATARDRQASPIEIKAMILAGEPPLPDMIRFYLLTWLRVAEGRELERNQVVGNQVQWVPPAEAKRLAALWERDPALFDGKQPNMKVQKNRTNMPAALPPGAITILERQPKVSSYYFTRNGEPLSKDNLEWLWDKARRAAALTVPSVRTLQCRDLRRTGADAALRKPEITIKHVQQQLRHLTIGTTEGTYTGHHVELAEAAVNALSLENVAEGI